MTATLHVTEESQPPSSLRYRAVTKGRLVTANGDLAIRQNSVANTLTDQSSILCFIEDNWGTGRIGDGSFDTLAGPLTNMFDFSNHALGERKFLLNPTTGQPL